MKKFGSFALLWGLASVAGLMPGASPAMAQATANSEAEHTLEEIIITARKKEENIQDAPLAVSALSGLQLERAGIDSFDQVLSNIPNASQSGGIAGTLQGLVSIRGISTLVRFVGVETGVGYYVDGIYMGRPENFNQDLINIERVEVLRGPQGALFGKNTIAGAINIITRDPSQVTTGSLEAQYGNYDHYRLRGSVSGPIVDDKLFGSIAGGYVKHDGFVENISGVGPDLDTAELATFRGKLRFIASDNVEFILSADALIDRGEPAFFEVADVSFVDDPSEATPFTVNQDQPNFLDRDIWGVTLTSKADLGDSEWTTIVAYRDSSFDAGLDDDKLPVRFFVDFFSSDVQTVSVETRYAGAIGERIDFVVGGYYFNQKADNLSNFALGDFLTGVPGIEPPIDLISAVDSESFAAFFNTNTALTDRLSLGIGGRFVTEKKDAMHIQNDMTGIFGSTDFAATRRDNDFSPTISLSYEATDNVTAYARFAQGFKSAGFNTDFIIGGVSNLEVDPESATSYEIGLKSDLLEQRLRFNLAGFYTSYKDLQLSQITGGGVSLNNAAKAEIHGVEAEIVAVLGPHIDLNGSIGYLDATYDDFPGCPAPGATPPALTTPNCAGNFLNLAPEWTATLGAQFTYPIGSWGDFVARTDWNYRSEVFFEPQNTERLSGDGRHLINLRAGVATGQWEFFAWVNNLTDETYVNYADDRSAIFVNTTQSFGAPRTFGGTARFKF
jgi:iron complex outermembrane receptor protein